MTDHVKSTLREIKPDDIILYSRINCLRTKKWLAKLLKLR